MTCHPRRDLALRYAEGSARAPVAPTAQPGKSNGKGELKTGYNLGEGQRLQPLRRQAWYSPTSLFQDRGSDLMEARAADSRIRPSRRAVVRCSHWTGRPPAHQIMS